MENNSKPVKPLSASYADAKQLITTSITKTMAAYRLPLFMAEGILSSVLCEIRANATNELADDNERYLEEMKTFYENWEKELQEAHAEQVAELEKQLQDAIWQFENPGKSLEEREAPVDMDSGPEGGDE